VITPEELATAAETYLRTGSFTEAAKAIGRSRVGTMQALRRASDNYTRQQVYARTLDEAVAKTALAVARTATELRAAVRTAKKPSERTSAAVALNDAARTLNQMRTAQAKLTGEHAAERHSVDMSARVVLLPDLDDDGSQGAADPGSPVAPESGATDPVSR
jgi:hypothetical protein